MTHASVNLLDILLGTVMDERGQRRYVDSDSRNDNDEDAGRANDYGHKADGDRLMDPDKALEMFGVGEMRVFCIDLQSQLQVYCDKDNIVTAQLVTPLKTRVTKPAAYRAPKPAVYKAPQSQNQQAQAQAQAKPGWPTTGDYSEMARALGVDASYISYIMNGKRKPSLELFFQIADHLHMRHDELRTRLQDLWDKAHPGKK